MPKIAIAGELCVSTELYNCLLERGLIGTSTEPDNFNLYLQECIARDNSQFVSTVVHMEPVATPPKEVTPMEKPVSNVVANDSSSQGATKVDKQSLVGSLERLYRR